MPSHSKRSHLSASLEFDDLWWCFVIDGLSQQLASSWLALVSIASFPLFLPAAFLKLPACQRDVDIASAKRAISSSIGGAYFSSLLQPI